VLDGGLPQWRASGYDVESSASSDAILKASVAGEAIEKVYQGQSVIYSIIFYFLFLLAILPLQVATALQEPYYCY
jgi:3-mercaptopyruvate sulfurtransferase SseA